MNERHPQQQRRKVTTFQRVMQAIALVLCATVVSLMVFPTYPIYHERWNTSKGVSNCRQIIMAMKLYAADHDGKFPDAFLAAPKSSNEVFRVLFKEDVIHSEVIFGCPLSPFVPDGDIGSDADKSKALEAGENHWAMTAGVSNAKSSSIPLVYENPVIATWPPKWNPSVKGTPARGRAWSNGIIIGMNDGSAQVMPLTSKKGKEMGLNPAWTTGKNVFEEAIDSKEFPEGKVLDVLDVEQDM